jgi:hypothetical protein
MALVVDSEMASQTSASVSNATVLNYNFTNNAGTLIVVSAGAGNQVMAPTNPVVIGGANASTIKRQAYNTNGAEIGLFYNGSPGTGSVAISVTNNGANGVIMSGAISYTGAASPPSPNSVSAKQDSSASSPATVAITGTTAGNQLISGALAGCLNGFTATNQTLTNKINVDGGAGGDNHQSSRASSPGGDVTFNETLNTADFWGIVVAEIAAAATVISETINLSDVSLGYGPVKIATQTAFQHSVYQPSAWQEYGGVAASTSPAIQETVSLSDVQAAAQGAGATEAETFTPSDAESSALATPATCSETATLSDAAGGAAKLAATEADTGTLSEASGSSVAAPVSLQETVSLSDSQAAALQAIATQAETASLSEAQAAAAGFALTQSEATTLSDSSTSQLASTGQSATYSETLTVSDAQSAAGGFALVASETVTISDLAATSESTAGTISETLTLSDAQTAVLTSPATTSVQETVSLSDSAIGVQLYAATEQEAIALSDSYAGLVQTAFSGYSETTSVSDNYLAYVRLAGSPIIPLRLGVGNHATDPEFSQAQNTLQQILDLHNTAPLVTGAKAGNEALESLLDALNKLQLIRDGTT